MDSEVKEALSGIKSAWKNMLTAKGKEGFDAWSEEQKRLEDILYQEKHKKYLHFRNTSEEYRASRRHGQGVGPGRPRKYKTSAEKQIAIQKYQHEYYLRVTKAKRAERRKNMKKGFSAWAVAGAIAFAGVAIGIGVFANGYLQESNVTITVKDKERIVDRDVQGSRYLIWSDDETFENVDSLIKGKFNSSDLYGRLEEGKTYDCKVYGWRNGFFSWYRNIIECKEEE